MSSSSNRKLWLPDDTTEDDIATILGSLKYREREILKLKTGLGDGYWYTNREIASIFKLSPSRISQVYATARRNFFSALADVALRASGAAEIRAVVESATKLTPYLMSHLKSNPHDLRRLHWRTFEHLVAEFFAFMGYDHVRLVGRSGQTGADIFALKKIDKDGTDVRIYIEVKRWKDNVGVEVIDRVHGAFLGEKSRFGWHLAMIVTAGQFASIEKYTPSQLNLMGIVLKDGDDVQKWLKDYRFRDSGLWLPDPTNGELGLPV